MAWKEWIWSPNASGQSPPPQPSLTQQQQERPSTTPATAPTPPKSNKPLTPDEQAEKEFFDLLRELDEPRASLNFSKGDSPRASLNFSKGDSPLPRHADPSQVPSALVGAAARKNLDPESLHPTSLLPTEMSCRAAFDAAFYCQSLGGQFVNVYRYGEMRDCSEMWKNFWFCMRTNRGGHTDDERIERIREHYWDREKKYRSGPSSEDVWAVRQRKLHGAFDGDFEALERGEKE